MSARGMGEKTGWGKMSYRALCHTAKFKKVGDGGENQRLDQDLEEGGEVSSSPPVTHGKPTLSQHILVGKRRGMGRSRMEARAKKKAELLKGGRARYPPQDTAHAVRGRTRKRLGPSTLSLPRNLAAFQIPQLSKLGNVKGKLSTATPKEGKAIAGGDERKRSGAVPWHHRAM